MTVADIAVAMESGTGSSGYADLPDTPTWESWFLNFADPNPTLDHQMDRTALRQPDTPKVGKGAEGNVLGTVTLAGTMANENFHQLVFPSSSNTALPDGGLAWPSATVYLSPDVPGVTHEQFLQGAFPTAARIIYEQGAEIRVEIDLNYRSVDTTLTTPAAISSPTEDDAFMWHAMTPERGATEISAMQSLTIELSGLARGRRNQSRFFTGAFAPRSYELGFSYNPIFTEEDNFELGLGSTGSTDIQDTIDKQDYTVTFVNNAGDTHAYSVDGAQVGQYSQAALFGEEEMNEAIEAGNVADISVAVS